MKLTVYSLHKTKKPGRKVFSGSPCTFGRYFRKNFWDVCSVVFFAQEFLTLCKTHCGTQGGGLRIVTSTFIYDSPKFEF